MAQDKVGSVTAWTGLDSDLVMCQLERYISNIYLDCSDYHCSLQFHQAQTIRSQICAAGVQNVEPIAIICPGDCLFVDMQRSPVSAI